MRNNRRLSSIPLLKANLNSSLPQTHFDQSDYHLNPLQDQHNPSLQPLSPQFVFTNQTPQCQCQPTLKVKIDELTLMYEQLLTSKSEEILSYASIIKQLELKLDRQSYMIQQKDIQIERLDHKSQQTEKAVLEREGMIQELEDTVQKLLELQELDGSQQKLNVLDRLEDESDLEEAKEVIEYFKDREMKLLNVINELQNAKMLIKDKSDGSKDGNDKVKSRCQDSRWDHGDSRGDNGYSSVISGDVDGRRYEIDIDEVEKGLGEERSISKNNLDTFQITYSKSNLTTSKKYGNTKERAKHKFNKDSIDKKHASCLVYSNCNDKSDDEQPNGKGPSQWKGTKRRKRSKVIEISNQNISLEDEVMIQKLINRMLQVK